MIYGPEKWVGGQRGTSAGFNHEGQMKGLSKRLKNKNEKRFVFLITNSKTVNPNFFTNQITFDVETNRKTRLVKLVVGSCEPNIHS